MGQCVLELRGGKIYFSLVDIEDNSSKFVGFVPENW